MKKDDQVWLQIKFISPDVVLTDSWNQHNHFTGMLMKEDIYRPCKLSFGPKQSDSTWMLWNTELKFNACLACEDSNQVFSGANVD